VYDLTATTLVYDFVSNTISSVAIDGAVNAVKRYSSVVRSGGFIFVFGGQDDSGTLYDTLFAARIENRANRLTFEEVAVAPESPRPPARCGCSLTAAMNNTVVLYGGQVHHPCALPRRVAVQRIIQLGGSSSALLEGR